MQTVNTDKHLSDDLLDQYRAGLLDDNPQALQTMNAHLSDCEACRQRLQQWQKLLPDTDANLESTFAMQRNTVLQRPASRRKYTLPALAIAASVFFALIGVTVFTTTTTQPPATQQTQVARDNNVELLDDIDFYIWLSQHEDVDKQNAGNT